MKDPRALGVRRGTTTGKDQLGEASDDQGKSKIEQFCGGASHRHTCQVVGSLWTAGDRFPTDEPGVADEGVVGHLFLYDH